MSQPTIPPKPPFKYNDDQARAIEEIYNFITSSCGGDRYVLAGSAGVGKTACVKEVHRRLLKHKPKFKILYTAPTNKATKVLRESFDMPGAECMTIYKALGLQLLPSGETRELTVRGGRKPIEQFDAVVVDEASMVNKTLNTHIGIASTDYDVPFVFMGDLAQLPPVGEAMSEIWEEGADLELTKVMRFDNQILKLASVLRDYVKFPVGNLPLQSDNDKVEGIWRATREEMYAQIVKVAGTSDAFQAGRVKAIAWRNVNVDEMNKVARAAMEGRDYSFPFSKGDRVISRSPAMSKEKETLLHTDDEATVLSVEVAAHPFHKEYDCFIANLLTDEGETVRVWVIHPRSAPKLKVALNQLSSEKQWKRFWGLKEAFHDISLAYAITAHRSQGSTYESVFVDFRDILSNPNRAEAAKCLYVACSRPQKRLYLGA